MERIKTILLVILVVASLVQSYFLVYTTPDFEPSIGGEYVEAGFTGTQAKLEDILFPEQIIMHFGDGQHTVLHPIPYIYQYRDIYELLQQRKLGGIQRISNSSLITGWSQIRDSSKGMEVRFGTGVPGSVLSMIMNIPSGSGTFENEQITGLWIFVEEETEETRTIFLTESRYVMYEATNADITPRDIEVKLRLVEELPRYHPADNGDFYLPDADLVLAEVSVPYDKLTPDQLRRSLFVDPALTRFLQERDGSQIYTDSKRGLRISPNQRWMTFTDPVSVPMNRPNRMGDNLLAAVQFINQHGGWNGTYRYATLNQLSNSSAHEILFREYLEGYPVISIQNEWPGSIRMQMLNGIVSRYERSLIIPDFKRMDKKPVTLVGGSRLDEWVAAAESPDTIFRVFPGYIVTITDDKLTYRPHWIIERVDGSFDLLR